MIDSEKVVERYLYQRVKARGGYALKLLPDFLNGLPDRIVLLPMGIIVFVELKTTKVKARRLQRIIHKRLIKIGFRVEVLDTKLKIDNLLKEYE